MAVLMAAILAVTPLSVLPVAPASGANGSFGGGSGTLADPYVIEDVLDLQNMSGDLSAHYVLGNDIDASATRTWNSGTGFEPVGNQSEKFNGSLDGRNHTIAGLFIDRDDALYIGLFGFLGPSSSVRDVGLVDANVTGKRGAGGLAAVNEGTVFDCRIWGYVAGSENYVGGLVACNYNGVITSSHSTARVEGVAPTSKNLQVGGLVGMNNGGSVLGCYATGRVVSGANSTGGLVGWSSGWNISGCYATGEVVGKGNNVGGLVGYIIQTKVSDCHASGNVTGKDHVGGLVGLNVACKVANCHATGDVSGARSIGGLIGDTDDGGTSSCYATGNVSGADITGGLVGGNWGPLTDSFATGNVTGDRFAGGLAAINTAESPMSNCTASGNVSGSWYVGGLVGIDSGAIGSCLATGNVLGTSGYVGGLVGMANYPASINRSRATGNVSGGASSTGGLAGTISEHANVSGCSAAGDVAGSSSVGGLVGSSFQGSVYNCTATGNVTGTDLYVGGLMGYSDGTATSCTATGNASSTDYVGGLVGDNRGGVYRCHATGDVNGSAFVGGLVGYNYGITRDSYSAGDVNGIIWVGGLLGTSFSDGMSNSHYDIDTVLINGGHHVTRGGVFDAQFRDWMDHDLWLDISDYASTLAWNTTCYDVVGVPGLRDLLGFAEGAGYRFRLASDVDLSSSPGLHVPYLSRAVFDGDGHIVSNVSVDQPFTPYVGLFAYVVSDGEVRDVVVRDVEMTSIYCAGGLVGANDGTVTGCHKAGTARLTSESAGGLVGDSFGPVRDCTATGSTTGTGQTGGLVGRYLARRLTLSNCSVAGAVEGVDQVGGLIGLNDGIVSDCAVAVDVVGRSYTGGLIGTNSGTVTACHASGSVLGAYTVGGLVGENDGAISGCRASGSVVSTGSIAGGLVGDNRVTVERCCADATVDGTDRVGGLIGFNDGDVSQSYATGRVTGTASDVGGLVGSHREGTVSDCYATADVRGVGPGVGGLAGNVSFAELARCYAAGNVSCEGACGGLVGTVYGSTVTACFWDVDTTGQVSSAGGTGENTTAMKDRGTFATAGWDFDAIWAIVESVTYPLLRWQDTGPPTADASADQVVGQGTVVAFDGSNSTDDIMVASYTWTFVDGAEVTLRGVGPTHRFDRMGTFVVTLNVTDLMGRWDTDTMTVTVRDGIAPLAEAGPDWTVDQGAQVLFDGSDSTDNVGVANYTWSFEDGAQVVLYGERPAYRFERSGTHLVTLTVRDLEGNVGTDTLNVTVRDTTPPVADAGGDVAIDQGDTLSLDGSASTDDVGIATWVWGLFDGENRVRLQGRAVSYLFKWPGAFEVGLTVTDAAGNSGFASIVVTVRDTVPPVADAGPDRTVDDRTLVALDGHLSSDNVGVANFTWNFTFEGGIVRLYGEAPTFTFRTPGVYAITLSVTDKAGNRGSDGLVLTVRDLTPPVADAGPDRTVPAGSPFTLDASNSTDNGGLADFTWTVAHVGSTETLQGKVRSLTLDEGGVYEIVLTVSDAAGNTDVDTALITVVDTGTVRGTVLDQDGRPVEGALVMLRAADGSIRTARTGADGTFALDVHHGPFNWSISKEGYRRVSGSSSVEPMGATDLDLSKRPLVREADGGRPAPSDLLPVLIIVLVVVGLALVLLLRRRRGDGGA